MSERRGGSEIVVGLVGAVGTDLTFVTKAVTESLQRFAYGVHCIHISQLLYEPPLNRTLPQTPVDEYINGHMDACDDVRQRTGRNDAMVILAIGKIRSIRESVTGNPDREAPRTAYVLRSLKHPDEVATLRRTYGAGFILLSAYSPREDRRERLIESIKESHHDFDRTKYYEHAIKLIRRDEADSGNDSGQNVRETFPLADAFVDASNLDDLHRVFRLSEGCIKAAILSQSKGVRPRGHHHGSTGSPWRWRPIIERP